MATIDQIKKDAAVIRDAEMENSNTAYRIGKMLLDIIQSFEGAGSLADGATNGLMSSATYQQLQKVVALAKSLKDGADVTSLDMGTWVGANFSQTNKTGGISVTLNKKHISSEYHHTPITFSIPIATASANGLLTPALYTSITTTKATVAQHTTDIKALKDLAVPATDLRNGYMTIEHVEDIQTLKDLAVPATAENNGYMTFEQVADIRAALRGSISYSTNGKNSIELWFNNGYGPVGSGCPLPVHGGTDGYTSCDFPALLNPDAFFTLSEVMQRWSDFDTLLAYVPTTIMDMMPVDPRDIIEEQYVGKGRLVYNTDDNTFLTLVYTPSGHPQYYRSCSTIPDSGNRPTKGKIYIYQTKTFIGTEEGLVEVVKGGDVPPVPPTPPVEQYTTGGGASEADFVGVIGGGGANDNYFA